MPINPVPKRSQIGLKDERTLQLIAPKSWIEFFESVFGALFGWTRTYTSSLTFDFGSIAAQSQATTTFSVPGARSGDAVIVRPATALDGIILDGTVTANDIVSIRAVNYSSAAIEPVSQAYRVIVWQQ